MRSKLALSVLTGVFVSILLGGALFGTLLALSSAQDKIFQHPYSVGQALWRIRLDISSTRAELEALAKAPSRLRLRRYKENALKADTRILDNLSKIERRFLGDPDLPKAARNAYAAWLPVRARIIAAIEADDPVAAYTLAKTDGVRELEFVRDHLEVLVRDTEARAKTLRDDSQARWQLALVILGISFSFSALALFAAFRFVGREVIRPTEEISNAIKEIASGNLAAPIPHGDRPDEIGEIARSAKVFLETSIAIQKSQFDVLTGLPLRGQLCRHIDALRHEPDMGDRASALFHFDLDGFSDLNDKLGRSAADKLLVALADVLRDKVRVGEFAAREGGDSFLVLTLGHRDQNDLMEFAERLRNDLDEALQAILETGGAQDITCTIGVAENAPDLSAEDLLANAEKAFSEARKSSTGGLAIYTKEMGARLRHRRETIEGLRFAIFHDEITPFFQPQVHAVTGEISGFEALVRWNHPEQGVLSPWQFVEVARSSGLLGDITDLMVKKSLAQLVEWRRLGLNVPRVSLNFTASDLRRSDFADRLLLSVDAEGLEPANICVELLESAMIKEADDPITSTLSRLVDLGFPIELDDFGTGHAAISTLHLVRLAGLKIDRSFVTKIHERPDQQHLTRGILRLSRALNISTIAEGVECAEERDVLVSLGCDVIQGFMIAEPMSAFEATSWLRKYQPAGVSGDLRATG